jgi:hypothetical protein
MNCNTIYVSNAQTTDTTIVLVPNQEIKTLENAGCYRLIICCNATATSNLPVFIQVGTTPIPVLCKAGNTMYANQLQKRINYSIMYGNQNENYTSGQFVVQNRVCARATALPTGAAAGTTTDTNSEN